jgi:hypothetical protein
MTTGLTEEIRRRGIPPLYAQENATDPVVYLEMSVPVCGWRWFVTECEIQHAAGDILFFGYVRGFVDEWGYFRLSELEAVRGVVLVDYDFKPLPFSELNKARDL